MWKKGEKVNVRYTYIYVTQDVLPFFSLYVLLSVWREKNSFLTAFPAPSFSYFSNQFFSESKIRLAFYNSPILKIQTKGS